MGAEWSRAEQREGFLECSAKRQFDAKPGTGEPNPDEARLKATIMGSRRGDALSLACVEVGSEGNGRMD